eukprot:m.910417 g.910417  ORF g.910417 m.910417 type:complete len:237 (-) comp23722_c0_seq5:298-1008(-)
MAVLVIGDAFVDIVAGPLESLPVTWGTDTFSPQPILQLAGGSAQNTASGLAALGTDTTFFTGMARDTFAQVICSQCTQNGVKIREATTSGTAQHGTGVCIVLSGSTDRSFVSHSGIADEWGCEELSIGYLSNFVHVHIGGYFMCKGLRHSMLEFLHRARAAGCTISLDTNYDTSDTWSKRDDGLILSLLPYIDVFLPNEVEVCGCIFKHAIQLVGCFWGKLVAFNGRKRDTTEIAA